MDIQKYIKTSTKIQSKLLEYIEDDDNPEENYDNLKNILDDQKIRDDKNELKSSLYLILKVANNHYRVTNFFSKIERILQLFTNQIKDYFTNYEIFNIFKSNKRILLFLISKEIITIDESIASRMMNNKYITAFYPQYFYPEIKSFLKPELLAEVSFEIPKDFDEKRRIGENSDNLCELIRNDLIDDFLEYVDANNLKLKSQIQPSIYETNSFLLKNAKPSLIEYAAFFGSYKIFNHLFLNDVKLTHTCWLYAIHGNNMNIIQILEDNDLKIKKGKMIDKIFDESIKCHHNELANHLLETYSKDDSWESAFNILKNYNFAFIKDDYIDKDSFYYLCKYDYCVLVDLLLNDKNVRDEINEIHQSIFLNEVCDFFYMNDVSIQIILTIFKQSTFFNEILNKF